MNRSVHQDSKYVKTLEALLRTADADGSTVDTLGFDACAILADVGVSLDTLSGSVYLSLELEESDDDSTWTDVAAADMLGGVGGTSGQFALIDDPAEDASFHKIGYIGSKRYVRVVYNITGTHTNGMPVSVVAQLSKGTKPQS